MNEQSVTGRLENWFIMGGVAFGDIYDDVWGRFSDGDSVRTSRITSNINNAVEGAVIATLNSTYRLGKPRTP